VIGYSEMLLEGMAGPMGEEQHAYVSTIKEKGEALLELIGSLLDMSKIEAGAMRLHVASFDVAELIEGAKSYVVPQATKKQVDLRVSVAPDIPEVRGDREKLRQSLINLLGNAVKFTPAGGAVEVNAWLWTGVRRAAEAGRFGPEEEQLLRIEVRDTGIGIPADKLEQVFQSFYQVDNSITRQFGGTGLGLAIVKRFVEAHGGEIWVDSSEGVGTVFTLLLPIGRGASALDAPGSTP
jgi:two-component system sensor histidine kinase BarA